MNPHQFRPFLLGHLPKTRMRLKDKGFIFDGKFIEQIKQQLVVGLPGGGLGASRELVQFRHGRHLSLGGRHSPQNQGFEDVASKKSWLTRNFDMPESKAQLICQVTQALRGIHLAPLRRAAGLELDKAVEHCSFRFRVEDVLFHPLKLSPSLIFCNQGILRNAIT
jgi:hypothetical protein